MTPAPLPNKSNFLVVLETELKSLRVSVQAKAALEAGIGFLVTTAAYLIPQLPAILAGQESFQWQATLVYALFGAALLVIVKMFFTNDLYVSKVLNDFAQYMEQAAAGSIQHPQVPDNVEQTLVKTAEQVAEQDLPQVAQVVAEVEQDALATQKLTAAQ